MALKREIRSILLPLWRWAPLLVGLVAVAVFITRRATSYMVPMYRASGTIQIDNRDLGIDNFQLYADPASAFKPVSVGLTEMEIMQSRFLIGETVELLGWSVDIYRVGEVNSVDLYGQSPFFVKIVSGDSAFLDRPFWLDCRADGSMVFKASKESGAPAGPVIVFDEPATIDSTTFLFSRNTAFLKSRPNAMRPGDRFEVVWRSREKMVNEVLRHELFIKPLDKEATLLKVTYANPIPKKSSDFTAALLRAYIEQSKRAKSQHAAQTLDFLDGQLAQVGGQLRESEAGLSVYRAQSGVSGIQMEMDLAFKERMQHNLHEVNYEVQEAELRRVLDFLASGHSLEGFSPNFEALNDGIFRETYLRAQSLELQKQELLARYTAKSDEVALVEGKINQLRAFLNESVANTMDNIKEKTGQLRTTVAGINSNLRGLPEKQRRDASLGRDVKMNEELYTHLIERRTALALAAASGGSYHRIIEEPTLPLAPYSPNVSLLTGLAVLLALITGMSLAWFLEGRVAVARTADDLEHLQSWPVIGQVFRVKSPKNSPPAMDELLAELDILLKKKAAATGPACNVVVLASAQPGDGKSFLAINLGIAFARAGRRVLLVDADLRKGDLAQYFNATGFGGLNEVIQRQLTPFEAILNTPFDNLCLLSAGRFHPNGTLLSLSAVFEKTVAEVAHHFDLILVDTPALAILPDALPLMQGTDFNLFLARSRKTRLRTVRKIADPLQSPELPPTYFILNDVAVDRAQRRKYQKLYAGLPQQTAY